MAGILAVFNDCAPEGRAHFENWYNREHLQERVGVPGFRFGRRYQLVAGGDRQFCAFYGVDAPAVLNSAAYIRRLNDPTPWTQQAMQSFRNMVRTVCDVAATAGDLIGSHAVMLRADAAMAPTPDLATWVEQLARQAGIAGVQVWIRAAQQTNPDTAEMRSRGQDRLAAGVLVVECLRRADADRVLGSLASPPAALGISGATALGIYALLCIYQPVR
jgi:hypothetical protein